MDTIVGKTLAGIYRIDRLIGRGGMARVYLGHDTRLNRQVAVKLLDMDKSSDDDTAYAQRFVREAQAVASLRHENIVQIYYAGQEDERTYYYVMEYIEGLALNKVIHDYVNDDELMPHTDVMSVGRSIAAALDYAHSKGVIHRDVKPSNVMISREGRVILADFGLVMISSQSTRGEVFGTPHYVSPEQARSSKDACPQSDLYSLGVILYEMLTGHVPFDDPSSTVIAVKHLVEQPPSPRELNPALNVQTEEVLLKALSKTPTDRYQSGAVLMAALDAALRASPDPSIQVPASARRQSLISLNERMSTGDRPAADKGPQLENLVGKQIDEYYIESVLGRGGMAWVYAGRDTLLDRPVAVKVIAPAFRDDEDYLIRFRREAQAIGRLEHPHIVRMYRFGNNGGLMFIAMQLVPGASLREVMDSYFRDGDYIEPEHVLHITRQICDALDYSHSLGVIHRDVKPENVLIDAQDNATLTDFGLALMQDIGTHGKIFGSPSYISPEQLISSANAVPQSDIYALGVVLFEIFTGRLPHDDATTSHPGKSPRLPRQIRPELSPAIERVILTAMAEDVDQRYGSGKALADALEKALRPEINPASTSSLRRPGAAHSLPAIHPPTPAPAPAPAVVIAPTPAANAWPRVTPHAAMPQAMPLVKPLVKQKSSRRNQWWWLAPVAAIGAILALGAFLTMFLDIPLSSFIPPAVTPTMTVVSQSTPTSVLSPTVTADAGAVDYGPYEPVNVELAGVSFALSTSSPVTEGGQWLPAGAEWLIGTDLRRVIALPYSDSTKDTIEAMRPADIIRVKLANGDVIEYAFVQVERLGVQRTDVLTSMEPSLVIILYGDAASDRYVVTAAAIQE